MAAGGPADALAERTDYSLYVVTAAADGEQAGCLAGFVTQCSIDPVRFVVCVSRANRTFEVARRARAVALHLLGGEQTEVASLFGEATGDDTDKFAEVRWRSGKTGAPVLYECAAWIEGWIEDRMDLGDHQGLLVTPVAGGPGPCRDRLTYRNAPPLEPGHRAGERRN